MWTLSLLKNILAIAICILAFLVMDHSRVFALAGQIGIHDPSTVIFCDGKYYTFGTGGTTLVSDDGWTWRRGAPLPRRGLAPDVIHIGERYYLYTLGALAPDLTRFSVAAPRLQQLFRLFPKARQASPWA